MKIIKSIVAVTILVSMFSCGNQKSDATTLETEIDSASYALGMDMAIKVKANLKETKTDLFLQGYRNGIDSTNLLINQKDLNAFLGAFFQKQQMAKRKEMQEKAIKEAEAKYSDVKKEGVAFLETNKSKAGVKTTESGLQYVVLKKGKGAKPVPTSAIKIHYHGMLTDGTVFDSSVDKKQPYESTANQFIKGFNEGLLLMKEGAKYKFFIPQELAYGATPRAGGKIKPFMPLIFEVELLEIKK